MSAAATAAGYLYASGRLRGKQRKEARQAEAEKAARDLRREREAKFTTAPKGARR